MSDLSSSSVLRAASLIAEADGLLIAAGAGMGVDSGLPDFRGPAGLWNAYPSLRAAQLDFPSVANPTLFGTQPSLAWGFYGHRLGLYRLTKPHFGFSILQNIAAAKRHGAFVFTSNVDGHFQKAGFDRSFIVECHGSINHLQCSLPCSSAVWSAEPVLPSIDPDNCIWNGPFPRCPSCGLIARPNILMFDDGAWIADRSERQAEQLQSWLGVVQRPVVIEVGAGTDVATVRNFSDSMARRFGAPVIRINPRQADIGSLKGVALPTGALDALTRLRMELQC